MNTIFGRGDGLARCGGEYERTDREQHGGERCRSCGDEFIKREA
ncbi:MAG TPA: hypothetical protein VHX65_04140 [Pirellulales bacterium]|jgi:hypothetical protein|nr:hypothetical protein [Pirellulales bacterium]